MHGPDDGDVDRIADGSPMNGECGYSVRDLEG
jgi:hypothetical protein